MSWEFVKQNKKAIQFLFLFAGLYFGLNTTYGFFIQHYYPVADPFTVTVTHQVVWFLSFFDPSVTMYVSQYDKYIAIANDRENMIYVYEGYNGLNVMIAYVAFLWAFTGPKKFFLQFIAAGVIGIHLFNIGRISFLYGVAFYFPEYISIFQKYLFTGTIYVFVIVLWYLWVGKVKNT